MSVADQTATVGDARQLVRPRQRRHGDGYWEGLPRAPRHAPAPRRQSGTPPSRHRLARRNPAQMRTGHRASSRLLRPEGRGHVPPSPPTVSPNGVRQATQGGGASPAAYSRRPDEFHAKGTVPHVARAEPRRTSPRDEQPSDMHPAWSARVLEDRAREAGEAVPVEPAADHPGRRARVALPLATAPGLPLSRYRCQLRAASAASSSARQPAG